MLYIHSDLKSVDFVQPLVCLLQHVLTVPVVTQTSTLPLGPELRASTGPFDTGKVANRFVRATAKDGTAASFKYLLLPYDVTAENFPHVFSSSYNEAKGRFHVGIVSTARIDAADPTQAHHQGVGMTAERAFKVILRSIARLAGLQSQGACVLANSQNLEGLDQKSPAFCPEDREALVVAGILKPTQTTEDMDCMGIAATTPHLRTRAAGHAADFGKGPPSN